MKYPSTPYHPKSPSQGTLLDRIHKDPKRFTGIPITITEKLDGSNTMIHQGQVYGRSIAAPTHNKWAGMVKKHHAWKVIEKDIYLYGENLFGIHSIEYKPMTEEETFRVFAIRKGYKFLGAMDTAAWCRIKDIPTVPIVFEGVLYNQWEIDKIMSNPTGESQIGGQREGFVLRTTKHFHAKDFSDHVCKSVRPNHVQTKEHWTRNWKPCKLKKQP